MRCVIAGSRELDDYKLVCDAIEKSGFKITELVSGGAKGIDQLAERWANENKIPIKQFIPDWNNTKAKGAIIKTNNWGKVYDANAGMKRNAEMAEYAEAAIVIHCGTAGSSNMLKEATSNNLKVFEYDVRAERSDGDYLYVFGQE